MKKNLLLFFCLSVLLSFAASGCGKDDVEPVTVPDTLVEESENTEIPKEPVVEEQVNEEPVITEPEEIYPYWDEIHDYSADQQVLAADGAIKNLTIQLGSNPEELHITWFSTSGSKGVVNFRKESGETLSASVKTQGSISAPNYYRNRAVISGLESNTSYQYQVSNGGNNSPVYSYRTGELYPEEFTFTIASDQEIGIGDIDDGVYEIHSTAWRRSLNRMKDQIPDSSFILSLGDHVARKDAPAEYDLFLDQSVLYSTPLMPVVGNHDCTSGFFGDHFYIPNSSHYGLDRGDDGDYWFVYGDVLFMVLNNLSPYDKDDHEDFIVETIEKVPDTKWRVVASHYSPASNVERYQGTAESVDDYFDYAALYDIDLFIGGHDHVYTRSYLMTDDDKFLSTADENEFHNPEGAIYAIFSTATGSLYRDPDGYPWAAVSIQTQHPQISKAHVTENSFTITTYEADTWKQLDTFTIYKD